MKRNIFLVFVFLSIYSLAFSSGKISLPTVCKGSVTCNGTGLPGIVVTDGINLCQTDLKGNYALEVDQSSGFIYVSSPAGYTVPVENSVPQFYKNLNLSKLSDKIDFQLKKK